jgi:mono/diheme cytochrome c family protein
MDDAEGRPGRNPGRAQVTAPVGLRALAALAAALAAAAACAQSEPERRLAAELVIVAGDVRRLAAGTEPAVRLEGLRARVNGALASLPLLLREAGGDGREVASLRAAASRGQWSAMKAPLEALRSRHPSGLAHRLPSSPWPQRLALGAAIHREACAGCHDAAPAANARLPALDLYRMAAELPREEFAARLVNGVRGDTSTALANPFSDVELGALLAHYERGVGRAPKERGPIR